MDGNPKILEPEDDIDEAEEARRNYQAEWWRLNGDECRRKRREKYVADPEYRRACQERAESYRKRVVAEGRNPRDTIGRQIWVQIGAKRVPAYTASYLATRVRRSLHAVNNWQKNGRLPMTPIVTEGGIRLYTEEMVEVVRQAVLSQPFKRVCADDVEFTAKIEKGWAKLRIKDARHVA